MTLSPKDHAEAVAIFRSEIVGGLTRRELSRGELRAELLEIAKQRWRAPDADHTRTYGFRTLERWYYAYREGGLEALQPAPRSDRGRAQVLSAEQRQLLLDIRREYPFATVPTILRTLTKDGRIAAGAVSDTTVRRLYAEHGLDRIPLRDGPNAKARLRWQAERPGALWHGDVCHGPSLIIGGSTRPLRIHGLLDDASRYVVALEAHHTEQEADMLGLLVRATRKHGAPDAFYLDNGSTYRGDILSTACARLGISLLHARPYDPQARGKMERFWRTLREGCLDFLGQLSSLHDVNVRLWAFLDQHYHVAAHSSLMGRSPATVYETAERPADPVDETMLRNALTVRVRRRVRRDSTLPLDGTDWETDHGFLAGRLVMVARCLVETSEPPWIEHEGKRLLLRPVDAVGNSRRKRAVVRVPRDQPSTAVAFDPPKALLDRAVGRVTSDREGSR